LECPEECPTLPTEGSQSPDNDSLNSPVKLSRRSSRSHCFADDIANTQIITSSPAISVTSAIISKDLLPVSTKERSQQPTTTFGIDESYKRKKVNPSSLNTLPRRETSHEKGVRILQERSFLTRSATDSNIPRPEVNTFASNGVQEVPFDSCESQVDEKLKRPAPDPIWSKPLNSTKVASVNSIREATVKNLKCPYSKPKHGGNRNGVKTTKSKPLPDVELTKDELDEEGLLTFNKDTVRFENSPPQKLSYAQSKDYNSKLSHDTPNLLVGDALTDRIKCNDKSLSSFISKENTSPKTRDLGASSSPVHRERDRSIKASSINGFVTLGCSSSADLKTDLKAEILKSPEPTITSRDVSKKRNDSKDTNKEPIKNDEQKGSASKISVKSSFAMDLQSKKKLKSREKLLDLSNGEAEDMKYIDDDEHNSFTNDVAEAVTGRRSSLPTSGPLSLDGDFQDLSVLQRWTCIACNFVSQLSSIKCEACGIEKSQEPQVTKAKALRLCSDDAIKPRKKIERPKSVAMAEYWTCSVCTLQNPLYSIRCQACQWDKNKDCKVRDCSECD